MKQMPALSLGRAEEARALLEQLAAEKGFSGILISGRDAHGRPTLCIDGMRLAFSRSYAAGHCALALASEGRVGVDLVAPMNMDPRLLESHFHPSEQTWLRQLPDDERCVSITRCWAAKEAVLKALGLGLAFGLDAVELIQEGHGNLQVARIAGQSAKGWNLAISKVQNMTVALAWAP